MIKKIRAKNDKLYTKMKDITVKYWELDKFVRNEQGNFIEDDQELLNIGNEIFNNFNIDNYKVELFADICAAPGIYSKIILDKFNTTKGIGISLPVEDGGVPFNFSYDRYKIFYKNILEKNYKLEINEPFKLDLGIASCVSYILDSDKAPTLNIELIIKSLILLLPNFKMGGNLIINMTLKKIDFTFNLINILNRLFENYELWKSETVWVTKNSFYYFGYNYNQKYNEKIFNYLMERIKYPYEHIYNEFLGDNDEYNEIYKKIEPIYLLRIKAWNKLIENNKNI